MMEFVARKFCALRFHRFSDAAPQFISDCVSNLYAVAHGDISIYIYIYIYNEHSAESASSILQIFYNAQKFEFMILVLTIVMEVVQL